MEESADEDESAIRWTKLVQLMMVILMMIYLNILKWPILSANNPRIVVEIPSANCPTNISTALSLLLTPSTWPTEKSI